MLTSKSVRRLLNNSLSQKITKCICDKKISANSKQASKDYIPVYNFPFVSQLAFIHKAKVYQTAATCLGIPASVALSMANVCTTELSTGMASIGVTACVILHTLGFLTSNTIGIVYLHKDNQKSKISYLDAWGSRRDIVIELKNIVPFSDQAMRITDPLYLQLQQYNNKDKYKMNVKYGIILNEEKFQLIFHK